MYKVEAYLPRCLDSVLSQTYKNIEIILVDDGSPDRVGEIATSYAKRDSRIRYIKQENSGLSAARNTGMRIATGEYFLFVDSDDWVSDSIVDTLVSLAINNEAKFSACGYRRVKEGYEDDINTINTIKKVRILSGKEYAELMARPFGVFCFAWGRLMHRSLWKEVEFPVGYAFEDIFVMPRIVYDCSCVAFTEETLYFYRIRETSISHSSFSLKSLHEMDGYMNLLALAKEKDNHWIRFYVSSFFLVKYYLYKIKVKKVGMSSQQYKHKYLQQAIACWKMLFTLGFAS